MRPDRRRRIGVVGAVLVVVAGAAVMFGSALGSDAGLASRSPLLGSPAPRLQGQTLDGARFRLADLEGSVVLVNVWASWCGPCREEMPLLASAQRRWDRSGLEVVGINTRDGPVAARALLREVGALDIRSVKDPDGQLAVTWGAAGVPETFLVDRDGVVRARQVGPVTAQWLRRHVAPLVGS